MIWGVMRAVALEVERMEGGGWRVEARECVRAIRICEVMPDALANDQSS